MRLTGTNGFVELPRRQGWRESSGCYDQRRWEGPSSLLSTFLAGGTISANFTSIDFEEEGQQTTVIVEWSVPSVHGIGSGDSDGLVKDLWELEGIDEEASLWAHPKLAAAIALEGWTTAQKLSFRRLIEDMLNGETTGTLTGAYDSFFQRLVVGTESFNIPRYVLLHTRLVRPGTSLASNHADVEKIFTYAQLGTAEPTLASQNLIAASGLEDWQWQKRTPSVKPTQDGLWELKQAWWGAKTWDTWIYDAKT